MEDLPMAYGAAWLTDLLDVMSLLQQGLVDASCIGGAEIDRFGNVNTTVIGSYQYPTVRLPGSGGGCDLTSLASPLTTSRRLQGGSCGSGRCGYHTPSHGRRTAVVAPFDPQGFWTGTAR
jgi:acyl CoA:acetate/3-ketoacid CoA transferase beta subunit